MVDKIVPTEAADAPYYNDYDETKDFYNILFRPGFAVQARELTQLQTVLQKQIQRFGDHVFKNGSIVQGAQLSLSSEISINLQSQYANVDINVSNFDRKYVNNTTNTATTDATAYVAAVQSGTTPVLMVRYFSNDQFNNDTIRTTDLLNYANTIGSSGVGSTCSISDGVLYIDGYFARVGAQTIILDPYKANNVSCKIGLELDKTIVAPGSDTSLLDPALEASNYQAPGASRYKINLTLAKRTLDSTDDAQFIEIMRLEDGVITKKIIYPEYSILADTLARRTNDESGSYTVRPFNIRLRDHANTANILNPNTELFTVTLDPGKAYIEGYEFRTEAPVNLDAKRSLATSNVNNYPLSLNYGNYLITNNISSIRGAQSTGTFKFDSSGVGPQIVDLHCLDASVVNNNTSTTYTSSKIGTARLVNIDYYSASNTQNSSTYNYKVYIADTQFSNITGTIFTANADSIVLSNVSTTNTTSREATSATANAYLGAIIRITSGTLSGTQRTITRYDATSRTAFLDSNIGNSSIVANTDTYGVFFSTKDIESLVYASVSTPTVITGSYDVSDFSKIGGVSSGDTFLTDTNFNKYLFELPQDYIAKNITDQSYSYYKVLAANQTFTLGVASGISPGTGEVYSAAVGSPISTTESLENFIVVIKDNFANVSTLGANGSILAMTRSPAKIDVTSATSASFTGPIAATFKADILAKVSITSGTAINEKKKTLVTSNSTHISTQGGTANLVYNVVGTSANTRVYTAVGQVHLRSPNKTPGQKDTLYTSDVISLDKVYDIGTAAFTGGTALSSYTNITNRYTLDTGQRDTHYDHGGIILKPGNTPPSGNVVVCYSYFLHETGSSTPDGLGYFSVDSYDGYANIPRYTSISTGRIYDLRDSIDFRPRRQDASNTSPGYTLEKFRIGLPNEEFNADYQYYLARKDSVVLTKDRFLKIIEGTSSLTPQYPSIPDGSMLLYNLTVPPYTASPANVLVKYIENKRYTMRDIGSLEKRIENLEYYTSLNLLEKDTQLISIKDAAGLDRTKNGILVDSFKGHAIGDVQNPDYRCSIDFSNEELRPEANTTGHFMDYSYQGSSLVSINNGIVTIPFTSVPFITQNAATQYETVQPYLYAKFLGAIAINPESDFYFEKNVLPDVNINLAGENDAYESLAAALNNDTSVFNAEFGDWLTKSVGVETITNRFNDQRTSGFQVWQDEVQRTTTTTVTTQIQSGIQKQISFDTITAKLGQRIVDLSVVPAIRSIDIDFVGYKFKPGKRVYFYFDDTDVTNYVQRANEMVVTGGRFIDIQNSSESIKSGTGNTANVIFVQRLKGSTDNVAYITDVTGNVVVGDTWTGNRSSNTGLVVSYYHYSGTARGGNSNTITLSTDASSVSNVYAGNTLYIVAGSGVGTSYTIENYNQTTKNARITGTFTTTPTSNTRYSIGESKIGTYGQVAGTFIVPSTQSTNFKVGSRLFRILDAASGSLGASTTSGDVKFESSGLIGTTEETVITTRIPTLERTAVTQERTIKDVVTQDQVLNTTLIADFTPPPMFDTGGFGGGGDPLSQTFFVPKQIYPEGLFLDSVDLFFAAKDSLGTIPVEIQIRPTVNGYPHSSLILPNGRVIVNADDVQISDLPDTANTATATTFKFPSPLYIPPGEYALVVYSDSPEYEVYLGKLGETILGTNRVLSEQPYLGSLFKSQNATAWTPFQDEDLMFVMRKCEFTKNQTGTALFNVRNPGSNIKADVMYVKTDMLKYASSTVEHAFRSKPLGTGIVESAFTPVVDNQVYEFNIDGSGRRAIDSAQDFTLRINMSTISEHISPVVDIQRVGLFTVENYINNANLSNGTIVVTDGGTGYTSVPTVTITGGNGSGAAAVANVTGGKVDAIYITSFGSGYTETPIITISGPATHGVGNTAQTNAVAIITGETRNSGGNYLARYITRRVELEDGFDSSDLRVFIAAYKPPATDIQVYYKIMNGNDPDDFDSKNYVRMQQYTVDSVYSTNSNDYIEYEYRPSLASDNVTYSTATTTYDSFKYFAIKIVMSSTDTTVVPKIRDLRAIALPAGD